MKKLNLSNIAAALLHLLAGTLLVISCAYAVRFIFILPLKYGALMGGVLYVISALLMTKVMHLDDFNDETEPPAERKD